MDLPIIGVLGGMGPYAGLDLVKKVFAETRGDSDQGHLPVALLSYSHRIADRTDYVLGRTAENPGHAIAEVAHDLASIGVRIAGIPCNSAHEPVIFGVITRSLADTDLRIPHLIDETVQHIRELLPSVQRIGCLSTLSVHRTGLYRDAVKAAGLTPIMCDDHVAEHVVHCAIYDHEWGIKAHSSPVTPRAQELVLEGIRHVRERGAEAVILGCTELPLAVSKAEGVVCVDPVRALARALIRETSPSKLKPLCRD